MNILTVIKKILVLTAPFIKKLIDSKVVPALKRKVYQKVDEKIDKLIEDVAQNVSKISKEKDELKKMAYIEGSTLGANTLRAMGEKLIKAADAISEAANG